MNNKPVSYVETGHKKWKYRQTEYHEFKFKGLSQSDILDQDAYNKISKYITIDKDRFFTRSGYTIDGATKFPDFDWMMRRAVWGHDALYQLMELGVISWDFRKQADELLRDLAHDDYIILHPANNRIHKMIIERRAIFWSRLVYNGVRYGYPIAKKL